MIEQNENITTTAEVRRKGQHVGAFIPLELHEWLRSLALREHRSMSAQLVKILTDYRQEKGNE